VLQEIVKTSPDFSAGWALLAAQLASATPDREKITGSPRFAEAQAALATAERIGPPGFAILNARARMLPANDLVGREPIFRESAERFSAETGGLPTFNYANFLLNVGRVADGDTQNRLGLQINPSQRRFQERQAYILFLAGKSEAAAAAFDVLRANAPGRDIGLDELVSDALMKSDFNAARAGVDAAREVDPAVKAAMNKAIAALESDNASAKAAAADRLVELAAMPGSRERFMVAALAALDHDADALQAATLFFQGGPTRATHILFQPALEKARWLPAFANLADDLGLMDYWRISKNLPDFCNTSVRPAVCTDIQAR
jgi:hypothetical protein